MGHLSPGRKKPDFPPDHKNLLFDNRSSGKKQKTLQDICPNPASCWAVLSHESEHTSILVLQTSDSGPSVHHYLLERSPDSVHINVHIKPIQPSLQPMALLSMQGQIFPFFFHQAQDLVPDISQGDRMLIKTYTSQDSMYHIFQVEPLSAGWKGVKLAEARYLQDVRLLVGDRSGLWGWDAKQGFLYWFPYKGTPRRKFFYVLVNLPFAGYTGIWTGSRNVVEDFYLVDGNGDIWEPVVNSDGELELHHHLSLGPDL